MKLFCAMCGKPEDPSDRLRDNLCPQCHLHAHPPIKSGTTIKITVCRRCPSYKHETRWIGPRDNLIVEAVTVRLLQMLPSDYRFSLRTNNEMSRRQARIPLTVELRKTTSAGRSAQVSVPIAVEVAMTSCERCLSTAAANEHFIIQIRSRCGRLAPETHRHLCAAALNRFVGRSRVESVRGGLDIHMQREDEANKLIDALSTHYPCKVASTYEKKTDRHVTLVRILDFNLGEIVQYGDTKVRIVDFDGHSAKIEELGSGKKKILPWGTLTSEMTHT